MDNQEAFNRMVTHLRKQGCKSGNGVMCYYRSPMGHRCAVGVLITDEFYTVNIEGQGVTGEDMRAVLRKALPDVNIYLLNRMQRIHDLVAVPMWEYEFYKTSIEFGLMMPPVEVLAAASPVQLECEAQPVHC